VNRTPYDTVLRAQEPGGAFLSWVDGEGQPVADANCFVTALVVLELDRIDPGRTNPRLVAAVDRALGFLERCEEPGRPGAFRFHPAAPGSPRLAIPRLCPDADDTAVALLALVRRGRRDRSDAARALVDVIEPHRLRVRRGTEPQWVRAGAFQTWLTDGRQPGPIDCCVNANVAALYAEAGLAGSPGCAAACATVAAGVRATGGSAVHQRRLAPYYAHPAELLHAVRRAVTAGAAALAATLEQLVVQPWAAGDRPAAEPWRPVCCNAHGRPLWRAPALQLARGLAPVPDLVRGPGSARVPR